MGSKPRSPYHELEKSLPATAMVMPTSVGDRIKYFFWRVYTPFHPFTRDLAIRLHIVSLEAKAERWGSRQDFLIGTIAQAESIESVVKHLIEKGYRNHFVAWKDDGEVVSLRHVDNFKTQYHVRIFEDGEVRAHYEFTPECYPIKHYYAVGFEDRREHFLGILGEKIVPATAS